MTPITEEVVRTAITEEDVRTAITEEDVRTAAKLLGYDLSIIPKGYQLTRDHEREQEIIIAPSLELLADFLKH